MNNILVGTKGWKHKSWLGEFYPDDLPVDWQLDYYSNQFHCILIQQPQWEKWSKADIEEIADNLEGEMFYFTLQVKNHQGGAANALKLIKSVFGKLFHGVLVQDKVEEEQVEFYRQLGLEITLKSKQNTFKQDFKDSWQLKWKGTFFSGFPLIEFDISGVNLEEQKKFLLQMSLSLPEKTSGALIYLNRPDKNLKQLKEFQILSELLGL